MSFGTLPDVQRQTLCPRVVSYWHYNHDAVITISGAIVAGNAVAESGGGVWVGAGGAVRLSNTSVIGNTAGNAGGGLSLGDPGATSTCSLQVHDGLLRSRDVEAPVIDFWSL